MTASPLISIIVPVYNGEKYLRECLDSLLAQTLTDIEIIVVDDGSTDGSAAICREYMQREPDRLRYVHQENSGQSSARNHGLDHARGQYIAFCDADDAYCPQAMAFLHDVLEQNSADIAIAGFKRNKNLSTDRYNVRVLDSADCIRQTLYQDRQCNTSVWGKLFRSELFDGVRFTEGLYYEDIEILPRLYAKCGKIAVSDARIYFYRDNPGSFISTWHSGRLDAIRATGMVYGFIVANYPEIEPAARSRRFSAYFNIFAEASRHGNKDIASMCYSMIKQERAAMLTDGNVRLKNKVGALASYLGERFLRLIASR